MHAMDRVTHFIRKTAYTAPCLMQASCQSLFSGLRVMLSGTMQGSFLDDSTSCFELLLEPSALEVVLQHRSAPGRDSTSHGGGESNVEEQGSERLAIAGRPAVSNTPAQPGLTLLLRCVLCTLKAALDLSLDRPAPCVCFRPACELPESGLLKRLLWHCGADLQHLLTCALQQCRAVL